MKVLNKFKGNCIIPDFLLTQCKLRGSCAITMSKLLSLYLKTKETEFLINNSSFLPHIKTGTFAEVIKKLNKKNVIKILSPYTYFEAYNILYNSNRKKDTCNLCGLDYAFNYDDHHFPIPKCEGGTQTIKICPNCHRAFHNLINFKRISILDFVNKYKNEIQDVLECLDNELEGV